jgi:hypothetical protein
MLADGLPIQDPVGIEMIVARQFTAWEVQRRTVPSRRDGASCSPQAGYCLKQERDLYTTDHTAPTERGGLLCRFQALNCLATIIQSLRDVCPPRRLNR